MSASRPRPSPEPAPGLHIATIAHDGLIWDAYLEFESDPQQPLSFRGWIRFNQANGENTSAGARTTVIFIEESYEEAVDKARRLDDRQLQAMLRSALPGK